MTVAAAAVAEMDLHEAWRKLWLKFLMKVQHDGCRDSRYMVMAYGTRNGCYDSSRHFCAFESNSNAGEVCDSRN